MRLLAYETDDVRIIGIVDGEFVRPLVSVDEFYVDIDGHMKTTPGGFVAIDDVDQVPPVPLTARVFCIGLNYPLHIAETGRERPRYPNIFARWASTLVSPGAHTPVPPGEPGLDWEAELAVVIGRDMLGVSPADAMAGVLGYTCFNDISARKAQRATSQFTLGKNADNSGPIGPVIVTADELGDPYDLRIESRLNGRTMQSSVTGNMIFDIAETISYISQAMTLRAGDVLATGTPDGVGASMDPPVLMTSGDVIEVEIDRIGVLTTHIA